MANPTGILTDSDREYIHGEKEVANESQKRYRMRNKVQAALKDYLDLMLLSDEEYELIFQDLAWKADARPEDILFAIRVCADREDLPGYGDQYWHLVAMVAFAYKASLHEPTVDFDQLVNDAITVAEVQKAENSDDRRQSLEVSVSTNVECQTMPDAETILRKLKHGGRLNREEIGELYLSGHLGDVEIKPWRLNQWILKEHAQNLEYGPSGEDWKDELREAMPEAHVKKVEEELGWDEISDPGDLNELLIDVLDEDDFKADSALGGTDE
jgi:hypothetical protein